MKIIQSKNYIQKFDTKYKNVSLSSLPMLHIKPLCDMAW